MSQLDRGQFEKRPRTRWRDWSCFVAGSAALTGCLPGDTRPTPGSALITVSPDAALTNGIASEATEDGWAISYQRFLIGLGRVELEGDACSTYSNADYSRIFDLQSGGGQKVSEQFAFGTCSFRFAVANPSSESLLGAGVSDADALFMRTPGTDAYTGTGGISIYVEGRAVRGAETKTFAWPFRWRVDYEDCSVEVAGQEVSGLSFVGGEQQTVDIQISGQALFRDHPDPERAKLRFDPIADADIHSGNADGEITLAELSQVAIADLPAGYSQISSERQRRILVHLSNPPTLVDYIYAVAFPSVARYLGNGSCYLDLRERDTSD